MTIISLPFAGFVLVVLALYYLLPRRPQNLLLLAASYLFYVTWSWQFPLILALVTGVTYRLGRWIEAAPTPRTRRRLLWLGIGFHLLVLAFFKYAGFFVPDLLERLPGRSTRGLAILLPVGLSFYVLQAISYLVDVVRRQIPASRSPVDFALYLAYFPKLVAGPIERARTFLPQLAGPRVVDNDRLARSFALIMIGVVRKIVIADTLASILPDNFFTHPEMHTLTNVVLYAVLYAFWLYNDFAGYTSVARGVSGLFGIDLVPNFAWPYFSRSLTEFWARWHISLSLWLRDYLYFPLSRALLRRHPSRANLPALVVPPLITMLASGLWHGTGWHMLVWGGLHGVYLAGEHLLALWHPAGPSARQPRWRQAAAMLIVFALVVAAWIPFSMPLGAVAALLRHLGEPWVLHRPGVRLVALLLGALALDAVQAWHRDELVFLRWPRLVQALLLAAAFLAILLVTQATASEPFVYQSF